MQFVYFVTKNTQLTGSIGEESPSCDRKIRFLIRCGKKGGSGERVDEIDLF